MPFGTLVVYYCEKMRLCSFDIFDTVLIRKCGKPENVFSLLAAELFPNDIQEQFRFVCWRKSPHASFAYNPNLALDEIYADWNEDCWNHIDKEQVIASEKRLESELLTANEAMLSTIEERRRNGEKIVFISDMYLDSSFLRDVMKREGIYVDGDELFVSCECKARKDDGSLYDYVKSIYHPSKWTHYGDNKYSDYKVPKSKGINAVHTSPDYQGVESALTEQSVYNTPSWQLSVLAGICRAARLKFGNTPEAILAADFVAPSLIAYVHFVLDDAKKKKVKTLYFLARDGYVLMKLAEQLPHNGIDLRFLFVSRKSLLPTYLYQISKPKFINLFQCHSLKNTAVADVLSLIGMEDHELELDFLTVQTPEQEQKLLNAIFSSSIYAEWQNIIKERSELACQFLGQEGLLDDNIALVDVGWYGSTRMMINQFRKNNEKGNCLTYYWGVQNDVLGPEFGEYRCFSLDINDAVWKTFLMEDYFLSCPLSSTIGYELKNEIIYPVHVSEDEGKEDRIFNINFAVTSYMQELMSFFPVDLSIMRAWSVFTINYLVKTGKRVDFTPLLQNNSSYDAFEFRKFAFRDIIPYIWGKTLTVNDTVCLNTTYGGLVTYILQTMRRTCLFTKSKARLVIKRKKLGYVPI